MADVPETAYGITQRGAGAYVRLSVCQSVPLIPSAYEVSRIYFRSLSWTPSWISFPPSYHPYHLIWEIKFLHDSNPSRHNPYSLYPYYKKEGVFESKIEIKPFLGAKIEFWLVRAKHMPSSPVNRTTNPGWRRGLLVADCWHHHTDGTRLVLLEFSDFKANSALSSFCPAEQLLHGFRRCEFAPAIWCAQVHTQMWISKYLLETLFSFTHVPEG